MDTTVRDIGTQVVAALEAAEYQEETIARYRRAIGRLARLAENQGGVYSSGLAAEFASMTTSPRTGKFSGQRHSVFGRLVGLFDSYALTGQVDLSVRKRGGGGISPRSEEFIELLSAWSVQMAQRGLAATTRRDYGRAACDYLLYLETTEITAIQGADGASVLGFLVSLRDRWAETSMFSVESDFRSFLKFIQRSDLLDALKMAGSKRHRGIVPLLGSDEEQAVVHACIHGQVTARDAAITLLALVTGLRACDLLALRLQDIDWRGMTIGIVQQKTHHPLTLPLPPVIAGKLAEYVLGERPETANQHVFLRELVPHTELAGPSSIYGVTRRVFKAAGTERTQVGTRLLRHNAASKLLRAGTPLPTISAVLGHSRPESTNVYLTMDIERMRACVLPLPRALQQGAVR